MTGVFINYIKVRKLLITAGVYRSDMADCVLNMLNFYRDFGLSHKYTITATMKELSRSKAAVNSYLLHEKGVYFPQDTDSVNLSVGAEQIRKMRKRKTALAKLKIE